MIQRKQITSSILASIGYDFVSKTLEIELKKNRKVRQYLNFPLDAWQEFEHTDFKDQYFLEHIKHHYDELCFALKPSKYVFILNGEWSMTPIEIL